MGTTLLVGLIILMVVGIAVQSRRSKRATYGPEYDHHNRDPRDDQGPGML